MTSSNAAPPLFEPPETITANPAGLHCDGGIGALGHPRVFLALGPNGIVDCPYCGRRYVAAMSVPAGTHD